MPPAVPNTDARIEFWQSLYTAQLDVAKEEQKGALATTAAERAKVEWTNDFTVRQEIVKAYLEVGKGSVTRAQSAAQFVQTAASAVGTIYAGLLGLTFKVDANAALRLDARGLAAALFLGLAIALATSYLAFLTRGEPTEPEPLSGDWEPDQVARLNTFLKWTAEQVHRRAPLVQAAVVSLGVGVALLPVPFISTDDLNNEAVLHLCGVGAALVVSVPAIVWVWEWRRKM